MCELKKYQVGKVFSQHDAFSVPHEMIRIHQILSSLHSECKGLKGIKIKARQAGLLNESVFPFACEQLPQVCRAFQVGVFAGTAMLQQQLNVPVVCL